MALRLRRRAAVPPDGEQFDVGLLKTGRARQLAIIGGSLWLLLAFAAFAYERGTSSNFYPDTRIGGVGVGSLDSDAAAAALHERFVVPLHDTIAVTAPDFEAKATPWDMGMRFDVDGIVSDALVRQHTEGLPRRFWHRVFGAETTVRVKPIVDEKTFSSFLKKTFKEVNQKPEDARLEVVEGDVKLRIVPHKLGREVDERGAEEQVFNALRAGEQKIDLPVKVVEPELRAEDFKTVILISTSANTLKLYHDGERVAKYGVATGTGGYPTPHGQFRITAKRMNPAWYNPNADWSQNMPAVIPPGPRNPLGTRALNVSASGIRIHGTPDDASIGRNASHGCIRMHMREVEALYEKVDVGTPVLIVY